MSEPDPPPDPRVCVAAPEAVTAVTPAAVPDGLSGRSPERAMEGTPLVPGDPGRPTAIGPRTDSTDRVDSADSHRTDAAAPDEAGDRDRTLMNDWCAGDPDAFDALYARHRGGLYRYALNGCGNEAQAHELFQDVWLRVIDARGRYSPEAPFRAWLYRIARNRLIDHYRRQPDAWHEPFDEETTSGITEIAPPLSPEEIASLIERGDVLHAALRRLPAAQREAIVLQHVAGMRIAEIAEVVGENAETVRSRLRYALVKLRQQLRATT